MRVNLYPNPVHICVRSDKSPGSAIRLTSQLPPVSIDRRITRTGQPTVAAKAAAIQRLTCAAARLSDHLRALRQPWRECGLCLPVNRGASPSTFPSRTHLG